MQPTVVATTNSLVTALRRPTLGFETSQRGEEIGCYPCFLPRYSPIDIGVPLQASRSDLASFDWSTNGITATFILPDEDAHLLRVSFDKQCIVRILDEMALSTEEDDTPKEGLVSEHFAYRLEGAAFARHQSSAWKEANAPLTHYQFVTGWCCMDVLTAAIPAFAVSRR